MFKPALRAALLVTSVALLPAATSAIAAVDSSAYRQLDQFMAVFETVKAKYVDKVDDQKLIRGAIEGMLTSLDAHSSYMDEREVDNMRTQTEGNYGGLGLQVTQEDGAVKVIAPMEDTPAWRAGMKSGDFITHLDGQFIVGGGLNEAVDKMKGKPGTSIKLTVVRPGRDKPFDVTITREVIQLHDVKWDLKGDVGIININSFMQRKTGEEVRNAIASIDRKLGHSPRGYVIDLRSNPGGLLDQAAEVSDVFLEDGEIVSQRGRSRREIERFFARKGDFTRGLPLVVLVDAGTASAAEIVAGALQDHHRALIMGERSFGKGSVQTLIPLDDSTQIRLTTARYYTPSGHSVQEGGIQPDITVPQLSDPDYKARPRIREADLGRHLVNESKIDNSTLESDAKPDPRFSATPEQLKAKGITDFQLDYALRTVGRIAPPAGRMAGGTAQRGGQ